MSVIDRLKEAIERKRNDELAALRAKCERLELALTRIDALPGVHSIARAQKIAREALAH